MWPDDDWPDTCFIVMNVMASDSEKRLPPTRGTVEILRVGIDSEKRVENYVTFAVCVLNMFMLKNWEKKLCNYGELGG